MAARKIIEVEVLYATALRSGKHNDMYVKVKAGDTKYKSSVIKDTVDPSWVRDSKFWKDSHVRFSGDGVIEVSVWEKHKLKDQFLGGYEIHPQEMELTRKKTVVKKDLEDRAGQANSVSGQLAIGVRQRSSLGFPFQEFADQHGNIRPAELVEKLRTLKPGEVDLDDDSLLGPGCESTVLNAFLVHFANFESEKELVEEGVGLCVKLGADATLKNMGGHFLMTENPPLYNAVYLNLDGCIDALLSVHSDPNAKCHSGSSSALHAAAGMGRVSILRKLLERGADPNAVNFEDKTALHFAARSDCDVVCEVIEVLIQHSADPNTKADNGSTPLHVAAGDGTPEIIHCLLKHGAKSVATPEGLTPFLTAIVTNHPGNAMHLFDATADAGHLDLLYTQTHLSKVLNQYTPLGAAVVYNHSDVQKALLKAGCSLDSPMFRQDTKYPSITAAAKALNLNIVST